MVRGEEYSESEARDDEKNKKLLEAATGERDDFDKAWRSTFVDCLDKTIMFDKAERVECNQQNEAIDETNPYEKQP